MNILVAADVMIDRYLHGCVERPNPDGRGVVFRVERVHESLGEAAAVARIVHGLGASVFVLGVIGNDAAGRRLSELLDVAGVSHQIMLADNRVTTVKERRVAMGRLLPDRVDYESRKRIGCQEARQLVNVAMRVGPRGAVLVSDYGKGTIKRGRKNGQQPSSPTIWAGPRQWKRTPTPQPTSMTFIPCLTWGLRISSGL